MGEPGVRAAGEKNGRHSFSSPLVKYKYNCRYLLMTFRKRICKKKFSKNDFHTLQVCRGGYFLLHNREQPSPRSLSNIKKSAIQRGEDISKKIGEMSCNFGEIIKNYISLFQECQRAGYPRHPPHLSASRSAHFPHVGRQVLFASATFTRENNSREGEGGVICKTVPLIKGSSD